MPYKLVLHVVPQEHLNPCRECGYLYPVLVKMRLQDDSECWKVFCPTCGNQTLLMGTSPVSAGDDIAIRDWNHDQETPDRIWCCKSCKAWNFGKYYKFCPYCGTKR